MHARSGAKPAERGGHPEDPERDDGHPGRGRERGGQLHRHLRPGCSRPAPSTPARPSSSWTARPPREVVSNLRSGGSGYRPGGMDDTQPALPEFLRPLLLDANNQNGVAELKALAGGGHRRRAAFSS